MRVTKAALRVSGQVTKAQADEVKAVLSERFPGIVWAVIAADDIVILETEDDVPRHDARIGLETR